MQLYYRMARFCEGPRIAAFIEEQPLIGIEDCDIRFDWSVPCHDWIICESIDMLMGAALLATAPPIGIVESLTIRRDVQKHTQSRIALGIVERAYGWFRDRGCSAACGFIPDEYEHWRAILRKRGGKTAARGELLIRQL